MPSSYQYHGSISDRYLSHHAQVSLSSSSSSSNRNKMTSSSSRQDKYQISGDLQAEAPSSGIGTRVATRVYNRISSAASSADVSNNNNKTTTSTTTSSHHHHHHHNPHLHHKRMNTSGGTAVIQTNAFVTHLRSPLRSGGGSGSSSSSGVGGAGGKKGSHLDRSSAYRVASSSSSGNNNNNNKTNSSTSTSHLSRSYSDNLATQITSAATGVSSYVSQQHHHHSTRHSPVEVASPSSHYASLDTITIPQQAANGTTSTIPSTIGTTAASNNTSTSTTTTTDTPPSSSHRKKRVKRLKVYTSMAKNEVVFDSIRSLKWHSTTQASASDLLWVETTSKWNLIRNLVTRPHQKVSRFPGMQKCVDKYYMARHFQRMWSMFDGGMSASLQPNNNNTSSTLDSDSDSLDDPQNPYSFIPKTFLFPDDIAKIYALEDGSDWSDTDGGSTRSTGRRKRRSKRKRTYVVKPAQGSQGNGIFLTQNIKKTCLALETKYLGSNGRRHTSSGSSSRHAKSNGSKSSGCGSKQDQKFIIQEYLDDPYLLDGLKSDLRVYVLLTSLDPLEIYVFEEGLARFCTLPYHKPTGSNLDQVYMHLSNYSLNKYNENFNDSQDPAQGSKRSLSSYFEAVRRAGDDPQLIWSKIKDQITKTCIALLPDLKFFSHGTFQHGKNNRLSSAGSSKVPSHCFQLLGFDFLVDSKCDPWLIELNHHPSFTIENPVDEIKKLVVCRGMKVAAFDILYRRLPEDEKELKRQRYLKQYCAGWQYIEQCESKENQRLMIFSLDPLVEAFIESCGTRSQDTSSRESNITGGYVMTSSKFYKFAREYGILDTQVTRNSVSRVTLDLLFIEAQKKAYTTSSGGLSFEGWLDVIVELSRRMYGPSKKSTRSAKNTTLRCFVTFLRNHILRKGTHVSDELAKLIEETLDGGRQSAASRSRKRTVANSSAFRPNTSNTATNYSSSSKKKYHYRDPILSSSVDIGRSSRSINRMQHTSYPRLQTSHGTSYRDKSHQRILRKEKSMTVI